MVKRKTNAKTSADPVPFLLSVSQAARVIGISRQGLWAAIYRGLIESVQSGPYTLIPRYAAERYAMERRKRGRPKVI